MDQDVGSSVNTCFCEHPRIICVGAEAAVCNLSGYIHIYINVRTGGIIVLSGKSINTTLINSIKYCFYNGNTCHSNIIFFEH